MTDRIARVERTTKESSITVELNLDAPASSTSPPGSRSSITC